MHGTVSLKYKLKIAVSSQIQFNVTAYSFVSVEFVIFG